PETRYRADRAQRAALPAPTRHAMKNPASAGFFVVRAIGSGRGIFIRLCLRLALPVQEAHHLLHDRPGALAAQRRDHEPGLLPAQLGDDLLRTRRSLVLE